MCIRDSFSTPLASPSSLMAYKLGGYSMKEMLKFSIPIIALSTVVSIISVSYTHLDVYKRQR